MTSSNANPDPSAVSNSAQTRNPEVVTFAAEVSRRSANMLYIAHNNLDCGRFGRQTKTAGGPVNLDSDNRWYALRIRPRLEKLVATHLRDKGYEEYLPLFKSRRRWSDRTKVVELPLFPGYAFCRFDVHNRLPILVAPGVLSIVGVGKIPVSIPEAEICSIQKAVASGLHCEPWSSVPVGHRVSVKRGPLEGLSGTLMEVKSQFRLILALPLLQRSVAVEIDSDCVEASSSQPAARSTETRNSDLAAGSSL